MNLDISQAKLNDRIIFLNHIHDEFQKIIVNIKFDKENSLQIYLISIYGTILELTTSIIILLENKIYTGIPILLRSALEGFVDLINFTNNYDYMHQLSFDCLNQWMKILNAAKNGNSNLVNFSQDKAMLCDAISQSQSELDSLKQKGIKNITTEKKFENAEMKDSYDSHYNRLCCDAHNNIRSLIDRHQKHEDKKLSIVFYKEHSTFDIGYYIEVITRIFLQSTKLTHEHFNSNSLGIIEKYHSNMKEIYMNSPLLCSDL